MRSRVEREPAQATAGLRRPFGGDDGSAGARRARPRRPIDGPADDPALSRLAELAATLLHAASAQVSVVIDGEVVVSGAGVAAGGLDVEIPAEPSLGAVTVEATAPVVVRHASADGRVSALAPVRSGAVGAYLGVPLVADGHTVGALCVFEQEPREWTDQDVAVLSLLTAPVLAELEFAALEAGYDADRLLWGLGVDAAGVGVYDWDLTTGALRWDERLLQLFGLDRHTFGGDFEAFADSVHPEDRDWVTQELSGVIDTCGSVDIEYRIVLPAGAVRWISARGQVVPGPDGRAVRLLGAAFDSTAVRDGDARVARILEAMPSAFFQLDPRWRFTYANAEAMRLLGGVATDVVGQVIWDLFPAAVGTEFEASYRRAAETAQPVSFEAYYPPPLDDWYEVRAWPTPDGLSVYFHDITARRAAEEAIARAARRSALLADATRMLTDTLDAEEGVARLAELIAPDLCDWCVVTLVDGDPTSGSAPGWRHRLRDIATWHADPDARPLVARYAETRIPALTDGSFLARALTASEPVLIGGRAADAIAAVLAPGEARDLCERLAPSSAAVVPLRGRGRTNGLLTVFRGSERPPFTTEDLDTLRDLGGRAGLALDNARAYAQQRDLAEGLQRSLLTEPPPSDHVQVVVRYEPAAEVAQVGGDWYDSFRQHDGATTVVIGDVVGHDTAAAAAMGQVRSLLRGIAVTTGDGPAEVLRRVDEAMSMLHVDTTATAVVARLEQTGDDEPEGSMRLRWSNAGHPPPLMAVVPVGPDGPATQPPTAAVEVRDMWAADTDLLLGLDPHLLRTETHAVLPRGATVLLYTDGLVESRTQTFDDGIERLRTVLADVATEGVPLDELGDQVLRRMLPVRPEDDVALVAVRILDDPAPGA
ncbi:SpoIIE family protein phosphatase [uncultured Nocardioides sp.]|uniref:SpoIIE family protein phosphatase n=1 Tax=uncultured Nocardioides sp. TaxID=198441 RepID=UPI0025E4520E|nr:SpoIIE family protein phosphatase [uncultured Nocardioides sp.]